MKFQVIYSRKIQGTVMLFTVFMFACQYGLTRETVAENFSRTGICWSEFALNVVFSILLIFLVWDDDYILSDESITFRRVIFYKKHKWSEFPYCGVCYDNYEIFRLIKMRNYCIFLINPSQIVNSRKCIMS